MTSTQEKMLRTAQDARAASFILGRAGTEAKNRFLVSLGEELVRQTPRLLAENARDLAAARKRGLPEAMIDRLALTEKSIGAMAAGIGEVALLADPVGLVTSMWRRPNGLVVGRMRIPLGVIGIIYESRPNVTVDAAALCLKSGNAAILRGGSEAIASNLALGSIIEQTLIKSNLPEKAIQVVATTDREAVRDLLQLEEYIDLIIPRGGEELIRTVVRESKIPVIKHYKGVCHIFVDAHCDLDMALKITQNAKVQRPGVCNALETLLVHQDIAAKFLPPLAEMMRSSGVALRGCPKTRAIVGAVAEADEEDWHTEYLDLILSVKVVDNLTSAVDHIEKYGSLHTEAIITDNYQNAQRFLAEVNSSTVLVNASTRFSDGFELGLGAEIGISTTKLQAYGPMGLEELTTTKFIIYGNGQVRL